VCDYFHHDRKKERILYSYINQRICGSKENNERPKAEFESDELRFYLYIFIKIQERFISLNFQEYKHAPMKTCQVWR